MAASPEGKKKVLVVDDEPHVVTYLETLLQDHGYATDAARDGQEALDKVKADRPDLILLDITMPRKSGVGFYRNLKEDADLASIPVIVVTAVTGYAGDPESFRKFISTRKQVPPPEGFVAKPIEKGEFIELIANVLRGRK